MLRAMPRLPAMIEWLVRLGHRLLPNRFTPDRSAGASAEQWAQAGNPIPGDCPVCGASRVWFSGFTENLRESGVCSQCGATNRQRQMAFALRRSLGLAPAGRLTLPADCRLYSAESNGPLHDVLNAMPDHVCSEYWGEAYTPGTSINGCSPRGSGTALVPRCKLRCRADERCAGTCR
jgi:hypothetical protein